MNNSPIGVFDSGMGGLSVWREIRKALPHETIIYYGDGANCPYGEKPASEVLGYIDSAVRELLSHKAKLIVLACNTATLIAVKYLRQTYDIPFVGMEPAIKPAAAATHRKDRSTCYTYLARKRLVRRIERQICQRCKNNSCRRRRFCRSC